MKYIILTIALAFSAVMVAQKREIKKISKAIEKQDYKEAREIYEEIDQNAVEDQYKTDVLFYDAATTIGNPASVKLDSDKLMAVYEQLDQAESQGFEDKAQVQMYQQAVTAAIFSKAQTELKNKNTEKALSLVKYLLEKDPDNDKMRENAANLAYGIQDFDFARQNYEALIEKGYNGVVETAVATDKNTGQVTTFPNKKSADLAVLSGRYMDARMERSESVLGGIVTNLTWIYKQQGEMDKAKELVETTLAQNSQDQSVQLAKADLYLLVDDQEAYEKAIKELNTEITDPQVFENLGMAAGEKGNWDQAIDYYQKSLDLRPDSYVSLNNQAAAYINKGNLDETSVEDQEELYKKAVLNFEKLMQIKPDLAGVKETLIGLYNFLEMPEKAQALQNN